MNFRLFGLVVSLSLVAGDVPDTMCMTGDSLIHGFIASEYEIVDGLTTDSGRSVWYSPENAGTSFPLYIYYYGDYSSDDDNAWWVVAPNSPDISTKSRYGYCSSDVDNPTDCEGCWYFYNDGGYNQNCDFTLASGSCTTEEEVEVDDSEYPDNICVSGDDDTSLYHGTFERSGDDRTKNDRYFYSGSSDSTDDDTYYLYYDSIFEYWVFDTSLGDNGDGYYSRIYCPESESIYNPMDCPTWYDSDNQDTSFTNEQFTLTEDECNANDDDSFVSTENTGVTTIGWMVIILFVIFIIAGGVFIYHRCYSKKNKLDNHGSFRPKPQRAISPRQHTRLQSTEMGQLSGFAKNTNDDNNTRREHSGEASELELGGENDDYTPGQHISPVVEDDDEYNNDQFNKFNQFPTIDARPQSVDIVFDDSPNSNNKNQHIEEADSSDDNDNVVALPDHVTPGGEHITPGGNDSPQPQGWTAFMD